MRPPQIGDKNHTQRFSMATYSKNNFVKDPDPNREYNEIISWLAHAGNKMERLREDQHSPQSETWFTRSSRHGLYQMGLQHRYPSSQLQPGQSSPLHSGSP